MKKFRKYSLFLILFIFSSLNSSSKFIWQNISAENNDILLLDNNNIFLVGDVGKILRSYDNGNKWKWQETGIRADFKSIHFIDSDNGFIVGDSGYVLSTTNSGRIWHSEKVGNQKFYAVKMIDYYNVVICGTNGTIFKTADHGKNWKLAYKNDSTILRRLKFVDASTGYAVGEHNFVLKTEDGGLNWQSLFPYKKNFMLASLDFFDKDHGIIGGFDSTAKQPITYTTTNGGKTWDSLKFNFWANWLDLRMLSPNEVVLVSYHGFILKTQDFFKTYQYFAPKTNEFCSYMPTQVYIKSLSCFNNIIFCNGYQNTIFKSTDRGDNFKIINWFDLKSVPRSLLMSGMMFFSDDNFLYYGETGHIFKSRDGGTMWSYIYPKDSTNYELYFYESTLFSHHINSEKKGFLVGKRQNQPQKNFSTNFTIETTDGGENWFASDLIGARSMSFTDDLTGFAVADSILSKTTDGGKSWGSRAFITPKSRMSFIGVDFKTKDIGYLYGRQLTYPTDDTVNYPNRNAFRLFKTTDGGATFDTIATIGNSRLYVKNAYFRDENTGFLFGSGYDILTTSDGGKNWMWQKIDTAFRNILSMKILNNNIGFAGSIQDTIMSTTNGGKSWIFEKMIAKSVYDTLSLYSNISVKSQDTIFLYGYNKLIRGVNISDTSTAVKEEVEKFNPYFYISIMPNPVANYVNFKLYGLFSVGSADLDLRILDIFGTEVADLTAYANNNRNGTTSEFNYNISELPVGVYIIKLSSMGYVYVKKLVKT